MIEPDGPLQTPIRRDEALQREDDEPGGIGGRLAGLAGEDVGVGGKIAVQAGRQRAR